MAWALTDPNGEIFPATVRVSRGEVWEIGYWIISEALGAEWGARYWKRWNASIRSAAKAGYKIQRVRIAKVRP